MNSSFHFSSAQEITPAILEIIKNAYQEKPVSLYVRDEEPSVPEWQKVEVRRRDAILGNSLDNLLDCDVVMSELERELETL
ncbi:MAG: hypothetical protein FWD60_07475 [Candidatus Azobacteroides sp.]|nr:hypothetical protein [Candidatus Azobacteroides sp.]